MNFVNQECSNQIREKPILENALSRYYLYERKFQKGAGIAKGNTKYRKKGYISSASKTSCQS